MLITHCWFSCCCAMLTLRQGLFSYPCSASKHKKFKNLFQVLNCSYLHPCGLSVSDSPPHWGQQGRASGWVVFSCPLELNHKSYLAPRVGFLKSDWVLLITPWLPGHQMRVWKGIREPQMQSLCCSLWERSAPFVLQPSAAPHQKGPLRQGQAAQFPPSPRQLYWKPTSPKYQGFFLMFWVTTVKLI